jgi:hypothetical protein
LIWTNHRSGLIFFNSIQYCIYPYYLAIYPFVHIVRLPVLFFVLLPSASCIDAHAQAIANSFIVQIDDGPQKIISLNDLNKLSPAEVTVKDKDGNKHLFKGTPLSGILRSAGAPSGSRLRGENLTKYVVAEARDGYQVAFSLAETDLEFTDDLILVAFQMDGKKLPDTDGPFRLVVQNDKKHARWIRQLTSIRVISYKAER